MKAPEPLYPCHFCSDDFSWPASDLAWSERYQDWVCGECWCDNCHDDDYEPDERGERLSEFLRDQQEKELATLRAKADAYDKGVDMWGVFDFLDSLVIVGSFKSRAKRRHCQAGYLITDKELDVLWEAEEAKGYTCRKVRVCEVVA